MSFVALEGVAARVMGLALVWTHVHTLLPVAVAEVAAAAHIPYTLRSHTHSAPEHRSLL